MLELAGLWLAAYFVGGIPFGYLVARSRGVNILQQGSGNIGATNVGRILGLRCGILVFVLDFAKGALPVAGAIFLQKHFTFRGDVIIPENGLVEVGVGLAAFVGHLLPVYLGFRGGKGVATGAGVVAVLVPLPTLFALLVWLALAGSTRFVSLASIVAVLVLCVTQLGLTAWTMNDPRNGFCLLAAVLVVVKHRANIGRLCNGTENRLPPSTVLDQLARTIHVLAMGLWFGGSVFFTFGASLSAFYSFERMSQDRPAWLPLSKDFAVPNDAIDGSREQGKRLFGSVVAPIFSWYFIMQAICGLLAMIPALAWSRSYRETKVHRLRSAVLLIGVALVFFNVAIEHKVSVVQVVRNDAVDAYFEKLLSEPSSRPSGAMTDAIRQFGQWHGISVLFNLAVIVMVTVGMCLTASLPRHPGFDDQPQPKKSGQGDSLRGPTIG